MRRKREEDTSTMSRQPQRRNETNRFTWNLRHGDNDSSCDGRRRSFKKPLHLLSTYRPQKVERGEGEVRRTGKTVEMGRGGGRCVSEREARGDDGRGSWFTAEIRLLPEPLFSSQMNPGVNKAGCLTAC